ncbi:MAG TPA: ATP-dependent helicase [Frankiaceae bacterium]|jgi:DNA helicase-2/ATP-dependent DNA helicase PcrA|nr:ATP-dependent helicase [Frankiaceae bacterium]
MFESRWDAGLDEAQLAAVTHGDRPLIVLAGAGTGKTRTLTSRVAHLLERGVAPERLLLLTFTRRAAEDMLGRASVLCSDKQVARRVWGGTFHAVAHRLVAEHAAQLGLEQVSVIDPADVADLIDLLRDDHGLTEDPERQRPGAGRLPRAATIADIYSRAVNTGRSARDVITTYFPWCEPHADPIMLLLKDFVERKRARGLLDFDDLLLTWRALLTEPAIQERLVGRWDHVLVDEYQDVNQIQVDIVQQLRPKGSGLTVVGDDAQAVYGFRGASSGHLLSVAGAFPDATIVRLERNFRSRQPLLDLANVIRPGNGPGESADGRLMLQADRSDLEGPAQRPRLVRCYDAGEEARLVADAVLAGAENGQRLLDHAVLMRTGHHSDLLEVELAARRIPFMKFGGLKFLEAAHVKDFLAALRVTDNPHDEVAWYRLLRLHEGIGPARAGRLLPLVLADGSEAMAVDRDEWLNQIVAAAPAPARTGLDATLRHLTAARGQPSIPARVTACTETVLPLVRRRYTDAAARIGDLERLASGAERSVDLAGFVAQVTLDPPASTGDYAKPPHLDEDYVTLSTVHSAKGLEWPVVHLIHAVDGAFPSDMALTDDAGLAEEQRLFYVSITRARDELSIYTPLRMPHHRRARDDRHSYAPESRFLTPETLQTLDIVEAPRPQAPASPAATLPRVAIPSLDALFD